jgi:hypothetical protein
MCHLRLFVLKFFVKVVHQKGFGKKHSQRLIIKIPIKISARIPINQLVLSVKVVTVFLKGQNL